jgi:hypothetical protein
MMPFMVHLWLAMRFRKWLRRQVGRKAGNAIGKVVIVVVGRPPVMIPCVVFRVAGLVWRLFSKFEPAEPSRSSFR